MRLTELIGPDVALVGAHPAGNPEIEELTADSREVRPGWLFAALVGGKRDGRTFAAEAAARGAVAILTGRDAPLDLAAEYRDRVALVAATDPRRALALMAARFYAPQPRVVAAVTGTNGKTSVVHFLREIWTALGRPAASLGTLGLIGPRGRRPGTLTTPDPVAMHRDLAALAGSGVGHVAIEASSHGLAQRRLDGVVAAAAAFTNLSRDHLDYHGDMTQYRAAKDRLFTTLLAPGGSAVLNADSGEFSRLRALCRERGNPVLAYGADRAADLRLLDCVPREGGQALSLEILGRHHELALPLAGDFQVTNALAALGLALATGSPAEHAMAALTRLTGVPGRLEFVARRRDGGAVVVDYAHTPDALATVLAALRPHARGRLVALFGCGGDRDRGKRPLMGEAAMRLADRVYVTDDNPRGEDPAAIRRAILAAAPGAIEIGDRARAIEAAIGELGAGDILVVAGKGHETGQTIGGRTIPFDDAAVARAVVAHSGAWQTG